MLPRHPNVIWELLAADAVFASVIADGHHLPGTTLKAMIRAEGPERSILVTDAIAAAGWREEAPRHAEREGSPTRSAKALAERLFTIGDVVGEARLRRPCARCPARRTFAGSSLTLDRAIANTIRFTGLPIEDRDPHGVDDTGRLPRRDTRRKRHGGLGSRDLRPARLQRDGMTITRLDWAVLVIYLVTITSIGLVAGYRVRRSRGYFLGGRRFGPWVMIAQSFTIGTHAEMPVALAGAGYGVGASAIWAPMEESVHHPALLGDGAGVSSRSPHDDGGVHGGSIVSPR